MIVASLRGSDYYCHKLRRSAGVIIFRPALMDWMHRESTFLLTIAGVVAGPLRDLGLRHRQHFDAAAGGLDWHEAGSRSCFDSTFHRTACASRDTQHVDRRVLWSFGVTSAAGGLVGALLHIWLRSVVLDTCWDAAGVRRHHRRHRMASRMSSAAERMACWRAVRHVWRLVGNQGGIRSAALLGFGLQRDALSPPRRRSRCCGRLSYAGIRSAAIPRNCRAMADGGLATVGVVVGTLSGKWMLQRIRSNLSADRVEYYSGAGDLDVAASGA